MIRVSAGRTLALIVALCVTPAWGSRTHRAPTSGHAHAHFAARTRHAIARRIHVAKPVGQRGIDPQRATEIQSALIHENYMSGAPTGQWDATTEAAMQKFQADNGWQTKLTPDSRALIKLGLGPSGASAAEAPTPGSLGRENTREPAAEAGTLASVHSISN